MTPEHAIATVRPRRPASRSVTNVVRERGHTAAEATMPPAGWSPSPRPLRSRTTVPHFSDARGGHGFEPFVRARRRPQYGHIRRLGLLGLFIARTIGRSRAHTRVHGALFTMTGSRMIDLSHSKTCRFASEPASSRPERLRNPKRQPVSLQTNRFSESLEKLPAPRNRVRTPRNAQRYEVRCGRFNPVWCRAIGALHWREGSPGGK